MFKGYIMTNGKVPTHKLDEYLTHEPEGTDYGGLLNDDIVQIDVDDNKNAMLLHGILEDQGVRCNILKTTRGLHFYFKNTKVKNCGVGTFTPIGIPVDVGLGSKRRVVPLKVNGKLRQWWNFDGENIDDLPDWLIPSFKEDPKFQECEARNQTLFEYIIKLQRAKFSKESCREILRIINTYMLRVPLDESELNVIMRDEAFSEEVFFEKNRFLHDVFGEYLLNNENVIMINDNLNIYTDSGLYSSNNEDVERRMVDKIPSLKSNQRNEVYKYLRLACQKKGEPSSPKYLGLKSGIMDIETGEMYDYNPNFIISNKVNYDYNESAYHELMDKTLNKICCNDKKIRLLLEEVIGYCLYRGSFMGKAIILTGEGSNGKSTFLNILKKFLGKENYCSLEPSQFDKKFENAVLHGKLANIGDDISNNYLGNTSTFKKLVTGESITVQHKGLNPFELESYATLIFCANEIPRMNDHSQGLMRRLTIVPFDAKFSRNDPDFDPFIEDKILTEGGMEYVLKIAIDGLLRLLMNKKFTTSDVIEDKLDEFEKINNPVLEFLETEPKIINESVGDVYRMYEYWCAENGLKALSNIQFGKQLRQRLNVESVPQSGRDGKTVRVYKEV